MSTKRDQQPSVTNAPMTFVNILLESVDEHIALLTLNRPAKLNAMSFELMREFDSALTQLEEDPNVRCIVVTGAGDRAFSAGGDLREAAKVPLEEVSSRRTQFASWIWHVADLRKPTIGAVNGLAYGGAALLASAFDIRVGCDRTSFRFLAATYGQANGTWTLPPIVGWARAKELLYTGRAVDADEALQIGLLNRKVSNDRLMTTALEIARQIADNTPEMVQGIKRLIHEDVGRTWLGMSEAEQRAQETTMRPRPFAEGFAEFLDRGERRTGEPRP